MALCALCLCLPALLLGSSSGQAAFLSACLHFLLHRPGLSRSVQVLISLLSLQLLNVIAYSGSGDGGRPLWLENIKIQPHH